MGMYAEIKTPQYPEGREFKYSGLISLACRDLGIDSEGGVLLHHTDVRLIIGKMWQYIYSGEFVAKAGWASESTSTKISMQDDLIMLCALVEWLEMGQQEILFI